MNIKRNIAIKVLVVDRFIIGQLARHKHHKPVRVPGNLGRDKLEIAHQVDVKNYKKYSSDQKDKILLPLYLSIRNAAARVARKMMRASRRLS